MIATCKIFKKSKPFQANTFVYYGAVIFAPDFHTETHKFAEWFVLSNIGTLITI